MYWVSPTAGLDCLMLRGPLGSWCGYVGVPEGNLLYGVDPDFLGERLQVHGGITWAGGGLQLVELELPLWWIGFDCGHHQDLIPNIVWLRRELMMSDPPYEEFYRDVEYVGAETESLARQVSELAYMSDPTNL